MKNILMLCVLIPNLQTSPAKLYDVHISRTEVKELNPKYVTDWNVYTRRLNRNAPYSFTANFTLLGALNSNVTIQITVLSRNSGNQYRELNIIKNKICDWLRTDPIIFPLMRRYSPTLPARCPIPAGNFLIKDLVITSDILPDYLPFRDARLDFWLFNADTKDTVLKANIYFAVVERAKKSTKKTKQ